MKDNSYQKKQKVHSKKYFKKKEAKREQVEYVLKVEKPKKIIKKEEEIQYVKKITEVKLPEESSSRTLK